MDVLRAEAPPETLRFIPQKHLPHYNRVHRDLLGWVESLMIFTALVATESSGVEVLQGQERRPSARHVTLCSAMRSLMLQFPYHTEMHQDESVDFL